MRDAFREYSENKEFRAMVDSGAICYVENHFVINDPIYVHETRGGLRLTAYGRRNLSECALNFTLRKDYPQPIKGIAFRVDRQKIKDVARYERDQNISSVLENIDELRQLHERFDSEYEEYLSITPSFGKLAKKIIEQKHLKNQDIIARSNLDQSTYSRLINDKVQPKLCTVAAFCFGIRSSKETSDKLFDSAGFAGSVSRDRFVYTFVLRVMKGRSIHECNAFLESKGVEIMGSQQRCEKHVVNE
jgi:transcriptional regulator with XRE-family HTH domain